MMGPKAKKPMIGKKMMRAASSPAPPFRRKELRKMFQRSRARAANWARLWAGSSESDYQSRTKSEL